MEVHRYSDAETAEAAGHVVLVEGWQGQEQQRRGVPERLLRRAQRRRADHSRHGAVPQQARQEPRRR